MENNTNDNGKVTRRIKFPALSQSRFYSLCEWVKANRAGITQTRPTCAALAMTATNALGFNVKGSDVANASNATGVEWQAIKPPRAAPGHGKQMRGSRSRRDRNIDMLARAVRELYAKFGEPLPDGFDDAVATYTRPDPADVGASNPGATVDEADRVAADAIAGGHTPKTGDKGRPPLPAPLVYAAEVSRPRVGDVNGIKLGSSLDGGNRVRH